MAKLINSTKMQVGTKREDLANFLNGLRDRLNVDEKTLFNLEARMTGKSIFSLWAGLGWLSRAASALVGTGAAVIVCSTACAGSGRQVYPWHKRI